MTDPSRYKCVLITGANGLIGSAVVPILARNYSLKLTDILESNNTGLPFVAADITKPEDVRRAINGVDAVVHLAIAPYRGYQDANNDFRYHRACLEINIGGTYTLFTEACEAGIKKFVYISSLTALLGYEGASHLSDKMHINPQNVYACSKVFGENLAQVYSRRYKANFTCLRLGEPFPKPDVPKSTYIADYMAGKYLPLFTTMEDIAQGIDCSLRRDAESFLVYSIVSDNQSDYIDTSEYPKLNYTPGSVELLTEWIKE